MLHFSRCDPTVKISHGHTGRPLLSGQLGFADDSGQCRVSHRIFGQHQEMGAVRIGLSGAYIQLVDGQLSTKNRGQSDRSSRFGKPNYPVKAVVVGESQCLQIKTSGFLSQLLWL